MSKEIQAKFDKKAKDVLADTLGLGSPIEIPANSRITLNGNKLLQLLIAKKVDVDAEVNSGGILLGCAISFENYLSGSVNPNIISIRYGDRKSVGWTLGNGMYTNKPIESQDPITFKSMLENLGTSDILVDRIGVRLFPYVALQASSVGISAQPVNIRTSEFLSFITITPITE